MKDYIDELCLTALCCLVAFIYANNALAVVGCLCSIIIICVDQTKQEVARIALQVAFVCASCISNVFMCYLPIVTYVIMHERFGPIKFIWVLPIIVALALDAFTNYLMWTFVLCFAAMMLAIKDNRANAERASLRQAYDHLRERTFTLSQSEREKAADAHALSENSQDTEFESAFFEGLTKRELAVVNLVAQGLDNREISQKLFLSEGTVRNHISSILSKKDLNNRTQIAIMYFKG